jgi:DNA-binding IclR family transcriptional regulator
MPLLRSATGRCFGAWLPEGRTGAIVAEELRLDPNPPRGVPASLDATRRLWAKIRREGVVRVQGALIPGIDALSAPVFDHRNAMVLALTVLGYAGTVDCSPGGRVERTLKAAAADLSARLGKT